MARKMRRKNRRQTFRKKSKSSFRRKFKRFSRIVPYQPRSQLCRHRYVDNIQLDDNSGARLLHWRRFNALSLYDTDTDGVGHQPLYFDQMATKYQHYSVFGAKMKITLFPDTNGGVSQNLIAGIFLNDDANRPDSGIVSTTIMEQGRARYKVFQSVAANMGNVIKIYKNLSVKKFLGLKDLKDNKDQLMALSNASPLEAIYFDIFAGSADGNLDWGSVKVVVQIDYIAHWTEPYDVGSS